jgi:hypothetical protein
LLDEVLGDGFAVVAGHHVSAPLKPEVRAAWEWLGPRFVHVLPGIACETPSVDYAAVGDTDGRLVEWLREYGTAVVRPDRHLYGVARCKEDLGRLSGALRECMTT